MSKNMRTRNLDPSKPMVIYDAQKDELPDRIDNAGIVRTTSNLPTGMEKEEELDDTPMVVINHQVPLRKKLEHHLQLALTASQKYGDTKTVVIPVPDFMEVEANTHDRLYPATYNKNQELYRVQGLSVGPEPDVVDYCIDEEDSDWLQHNGASLGISVDRFEAAIDRLEKSVGIREPTETDAMKILKERPDIVSALSKYWLSRRKKLKHPLLLKVRTDNKREAASGHDPYVAFRRRAEKMQTRKNRKSDEQNYVIMYKMKIAHTHHMKDGLMEILKRTKEREILKIRITEMERHEFHINHCYFDDAYGEHYAHILSAYTQLNLIDAETADDGANEGEEEYESGESVEEMSDIYDSDSVETNSWSDMHPSARDDARARSPRYDMENDPNLKDFPAPLVVDPNLVSESQYKGDEPPEYWGPDGEFTFVPRKDCRYVEDKMDCETESDGTENQLDGFYFQECPVIIKGGSTVMKTVLGCRTIGLGGVRKFVYYKLPDYLESFDLNLIQADTNYDVANLSEHPDRNVFHKYKDRVYKYAPEMITETSTFPEEPQRQALTDALLEDIYQFALTWNPAPEMEPMVTGEDYDLYHVACSSVCQPLQEHNYFTPAAARDLASRLGDTPDLDMEDIHNLAAATELLAADTLAEGSNDPSRNFIDSAPPTPLQSEVESLSSFLDPSQNNAKKRKAPAKPKGIKMPDSLPIPVKRARPTKAASEGTKPANETPKPPRKKAKVNGFVDALENKNGLLLSMPPALVPPPIATSVIKTPAVKRRAPAKKTDSTPKTEAVLSADPRESAKKPTKRVQNVRPAANKRLRKDEISLPQPLSFQSPAILKAPQRPILPQPTSGNASPVTGGSSSSLTFSPTSLRTQSLSGTASARAATFQPNLQALLAPSNGISTNGFLHSTPGSPIVTPNGLGMGITASHTSKLC